MEQGISDPDVDQGAWMGGPPGWVLVWIWALALIGSGVAAMCGAAGPFRFWSNITAVSAATGFFATLVSTFLVYRYKRGQLKVQNNMRPQVTP